MNSYVTKWLFHDYFVQGRILLELCLETEGWGEYNNKQSMVYLLSCVLHILTSMRHFCKDLFLLYALLNMCIEYKRCVILIGLCWRSKLAGETTWIYNILSSHNSNINIHVSCKPLKPCQHKGCHAYNCLLLGLFVILDTTPNKINPTRFNEFNIFSNFPPAKYNEKYQVV